MDQKRHTDWAEGPQITVSFARERMSSCKSICPISGRFGMALNGSELEDDSEQLAILDDVLGFRDKYKSSVRKISQ